MAQILAFCSLLLGVGGREDGECSVLYIKVSKVMELTELAMENKLLSV